MKLKQLFKFVFFSLITITFSISIYFNVTYIDEINLFKIDLQDINETVRIQSAEIKNLTTSKTSTDILEVNNIRSKDGEDITIQL